MHKIWNKLLWPAILALLTLAIGELLLSGDILIFLSPRMVPMVWFGFAVLSILLLYQILQFARQLHHGDLVHGGQLGILLFLVPLLLFATVTPDQGTSGTLPNQNMNMLSITAKQENSSKNNQFDTLDFYTPCTLETETAAFNPAEDRFAEYLSQSLDDVIGKTITLFGFVYKQDTFPENTILLSRKMISCCAADAAIVGFYVQLEDASLLDKNEWIRVTGTIRSINLEYYQNYYDFPILTKGIVVRCTMPEADEAYVYPN